MNPLAAGAASAACALAVIGLLLAERRGARRTRAVCKTAASGCFVAVALLLGAPASAWGAAILAALLLGLVGDVLLLSDRSTPFLAGLGAFLLSHGCYAAAFWQAGVSPRAVAIGALLALPVGLGILRWLWPHLGARFRGPVLAYVLTILAMCTLAGGGAAQHGRWGLLAAALVFAASDIAVARERFVAPGFVNRAWGLPAYYAAQLGFACSVAG